MSYLGDFFVVVVVTVPTPLSYDLWLDPLALWLASEYQANDEASDYFLSPAKGGACSMKLVFIRNSDGSLAS